MSVFINHACLTVLLCNFILSLFCNKSTLTFSIILILFIMHNAIKPMLILHEIIFLIRPEILFHDIHTSAGQSPILASFRHAFRVPILSYHVPLLIISNNLHKSLGMHRHPRPAFCTYSSGSFMICAYKKTLP